MLLLICFLDQNVNDPVRSPEVTSPAAKHQLVQQVLSSEVETFIGRKLNQVSEPEIESP